MAENPNLFRNNCKKILQHHLVHCFRDIIGNYAKNDALIDEIIIKFIPNMKLLQHHGINKNILQKDGSMTIILKKSHSNNLVIRDEQFQIDIKIGKMVHREFPVRYMDIVAIVIPACDFYIDLGESFKEINPETLTEDNIIVHDFTSDQE